ncbi:MAG: glycosyltransferase family 2 protein [Chloroflexi bacterium]|nr:MAG: glycosyltransferase family 2 protein [Chloroflexota bacterium]
MTLAEVRYPHVSARNGAGRAADGLHPVPRRILEVLPPALAWAALTSPGWAAIVAPELLGYFLVAFAAYWLWRSCEFTAGLVIGLAQLHLSQRRDWAADGSQLPGYERLHHVVIVPTFKESDEILSETLTCLARQTAPAERITVVMAFEDRDPHAPARAARLSRRFARRFGHWLITTHPDLPGEVKGKSSNLAWAARRVAEELIGTGVLDARNLLVTVCDADSRMDRQYLAALGHQVLSHPDGRLHIYQPAILFYANYARLALPLRAVSSVFSLYSLARLAATHRLVPQSTYSLSWWAARRVGFWDVDVVPEDSHMFFKVWLHLGKRVRTRAIHLPVYADAAEGVDLWRSATSTYQQIRRWAWGVSDVPYLTLRTLRAQHIPWYVRFSRLGWYIEEHLVWPSHWFLLTLGGLLPPLLNHAYAHSPLGVWQTAAFSTLLGLCLPSLVLAIAADLVLKLRSGEERNVWALLGGLLGFALLPFTGLAMVALPALDAHTRLLFGRSLAYQVTEKQPRQASSALRTGAASA